jgi:beta-lactam-binding protein with PASTA domain
VKLAAGVGAVLVSACLLIAGSSSSGHVVVVPTVVGDGVNFAYWRLRYEGFAVWIDEPIDLGASVARQSPAPARRVRRGTVVALELEHSSLHGMLEGSGTIKMPRLIGKRLDVATGLLNGLGLSWTTAPLPPLPPSSAPSLLANYEVREQRPAPGSRFVQTVVTPIPGGIRTETTTVGLEAKLRFNGVARVARR